MAVSIVQGSRQPSGVREDIRDIVALTAAAVLLCAALLFGGGPRGMGDLIVHLAALPCAWLGIVRWRQHAASRWQRWFLAWWLLALAVVSVQLLPLPSAWFAGMAPRASIAHDLGVAAAAGAWRPMTLDTWGTVRALLALLTFGSFWLLACTLQRPSRVRLLQLALVVAAAMALLGFAQAAAGEHAPFRFHGYHHPIGAIGTFANRNHFASLLAMLLPLAFAFGVAAQGERKTAAMTAWWALTVALWLAAALSFSRAGFALASLALGVTAAIAFLRGRSGAGRYAVPAAAAMVAMLAIGHYAWSGLAQRLALDPLDDLRWQYLRHGVEVMQAYLPWGSGLGSFPWVYAAGEPVAAMLNVYAERAHNDVLQVVIEAGIAGSLVIFLYIALVLAAAARSFPMGREGVFTDHLQRSATAVSLLVPLFHSLVDYPLRTLAVAVLTALLLSLAGPEERT